MGCPTCGKSNKGSGIPNNRFASLKTVQRNSTIFDETTVAGVRTFANDNIDLMFAVADQTELPQSRELAIKALGELNAREELISLLDGEIVPPAIELVTIVAMLLGDEDEIPASMNFVSDIQSNDITVESLAKDYPTKDLLRSYAANLDYPKFKARKLENMYVELIKYLETV